MNKIKRLALVEFERIKPFALAEFERIKSFLGL